MAFLRKFAWIAGLFMVASDPLAGFFTLLMMGSARKELDDGVRGSADPEKPDAYDMWPTQLIPVPRMPNLSKMQTTELIMREPQHINYLVKLDRSDNEKE